MQLYRAAYRKTTAFERRGAFQKQLNLQTGKGMMIPDPSWGRADLSGIAFTSESKLHPVGDGVRVGHEAERKDSRKASAHRWGFPPTRVSFLESPHPMPGCLHSGPSPVRAHIPSQLAPCCPLHSCRCPCGRPSLPLEHATLGAHSLCCFLMLSAQPVCPFLLPHSSRCLIPSEKSRIQC